ncbi:MAG: hypothetical protein ABSF80_07070 [Chitinispirillaceae bacterium]|jgi:hypothetical protein
MKLNLQQFAYFLILVCFLWFPFQDLFLSLAYKYYPSPALKIALVGKEACIVIVLAVLFFRKLIHFQFAAVFSETLALFFIVVCVMYVTILRADDVSAITAATSFRSAILPSMLFLTGFWLAPSFRQLQFIIKMVVIISIINVLVGFYESLVPVNIFWNRALNLYGYLTNIKGLRTGLEGGFVNFVPGNFWAFIGIRRMAGAIGSPLALGYYLILPLILMISKLKVIKAQNIVILFLITGLLLTQTRAAITGVFIGIFGYYLTQEGLFKMKINKKWLFVLISCISIITILASTPDVRKFIVLTITAKESNASAHSIALERSFKSIQQTILIGKGFGLAGGWASTQTGFSAAGESAYLSLMYQTGGIGLAIFLFWWFMIVADLYKQGKHLSNRYLYQLSCAFIFANIAYMVSAAISEQIFTFTSVAHFWFLNGAILSMFKVELKTHAE